MNQTNLLFRKKDDKIYDLITELVCNMNKYTC